MSDDGDGMAGIGIVGAGISGLTLALRLQQLGIEPTLYVEGDPGEGRLPNTVVRMGHTLARENELGSEHHRAPAAYIHRIEFSIKDEPPLEFTGRPPAPMQGTDLRLLLPALLADFGSRGGTVRPVASPVGAEEVARWSAEHELMVVAAGRGSVTELFPRDPARSPYDGPQRRLTAGLFHGVELESGVSFNISPGNGEIFGIPLATRDGVVSGLLVEAIAGGPLEAISELPWDQVSEAMLALVREHAPRLAGRVNPAEFGLLGPLDLLQGAITPTVREPVAELPGGRIALAVGDAWIANDPVTGQGANLGSICAWIVADAIAAGGPYDADFGRTVAEAMWRIGGPVTEWTNATLQPPPEHLLDLFTTATTRAEVADLIAGFFSDPVAAWSLLSNPDEVARVVNGERTKL